MSLSLASFEALVMGVQPSATVHRKAFGSFLSAAGRAASVHSDAARLSSGPSYLRGNRSEAVMLLTCHAFNLYVDFVGAVFDGRFDAACYLARPFADVSSLLRFVGSDEATATGFLSGTGEVKASAARIDAVARLREIDTEAADEVDRIFREDFEAANTLSHVNVAQLAKLVERTGPDSRRATLGGRVDVDEATSMLRLASYCEVMTLSALRQIGEFGKQWDDRCIRATDAVMAWSRST